MSSAWWLGWNCMLGLGARSHTAQNLLREKECVLNLPSVGMVAAVNRLARLTGSDPVPPHKVAMGYRHEKDKLGAAGLSASPSDLVQAPRVAECPVQLEAVLESTHPFGNRPDKATTADCIRSEDRAHTYRRTHPHGRSTRIASIPDKWRPLIMSFCQFYGLGRTGVAIDAGRDSRSALPSCPADDAVRFRGRPGRGPQPRLRPRPTGN